MIACGSNAADASRPEILIGRLLGLRIPQRRFWRLDLVSGICYLHVHTGHILTEMSN